MLVPLKSLTKAVLSAFLPKVCNLRARSNLAFACFIPLTWVKWEAEEENRRKGNQMKVSAVNVWTTNNYPLQSRADAVIISLSSLCFLCMFKSAPPGLGIHAYLWVTYQELGGGEGGRESSHNSGCLGCPVKSAGLTVDWKRVHTHSYPVTWGWDWLPLTEMMWKDKSMIVTSPLRGNPILAVYFLPLLTERSQPPISKRRGELYCASILNNLTNYFTKDEMFIPLYDNYLPNSSILVFGF